MIYWETDNKYNMFFDDANESGRDDKRDMRHTNRLDVQRKDKISLIKGVYFDKVSGSDVNNMV